ncbi:MAG TPA: alanine--tRNA ligase [Candidatus Saccharimonas sp.]|nr:alanine--tRNA ligase [Candidatus Saccharimonas sp.]
MTAQDIRKAYFKYMADRGHAIIPRDNLVPKEDPTTLFVGSGMQPLLPYLLGQPHPAGKQVADSQTAFRAEDIDEVGDNRHTTLFEMLGNWSFGTYFKAEQLPWFWEFLTGVVGLDPDRLYVTVFAGDPDNHIPQDDESKDIWVRLFAQKGITAESAHIGSEKAGYDRGIKPDERIFYYDAKKNWWSRAGVPANMPAGEPGGPDSEVFYEFPHIEHNPEFGKHCHPNCDCGRFIEVGNSVFMQYIKNDKGGFDELPQRNVDFGGGLERIAQAVEGSGDMFRISVIWPIIQKLEQLSGFRYDQNPGAMRIIADHLRSCVWLAVDGVVPSNTAQGYVMRRFLRRAIRQALALDLKEDFLELVVPVIVDLYRDDFPEMADNEKAVIDTLVREEQQFRKTLERGVRLIEHEFLTVVGPIEPAGKDQVKVQVQPIDGKVMTGEDIFRLFDTYGFPYELSLEEAHRFGIPVDQQWRESFDKLLAEQKDRSRTATAGQFKGGLADHSEMSTKYHTATHLMYKALRLVLGDHVIQRGSNITPERLRFDFSHSDKMTPEQIKQVEDIVNEQIAKDWPMGFREEPTKEALASGVMGAFGDRYGDIVKIYTVGDPDGAHYSREICGGPHVEHTGTLAEGGKTFKIKKEESSSAGVRRIKAVLE